ncbi:proteophosphoglycan ppg3, putative, partial [Leishmania panamensis]
RLQCRVRLRARGLRRLQRNLHQILFFHHRHLLLLIEHFMMRCTSTART